MTDNYTQSIEVPMSKSTRLKQIICLCLFLIAITLLIISATVNWYIAIAGAVVGYLGGVYLHLFNKSPKQYIYNCSRERIVISMTDVANRTKRIASIEYQDVKRFEVFSDLADNIDVNATSNIGNVGVYLLEYNEGIIERKLCFEPDDYMIAFIKQNLTNSRKNTEDLCKN